MSIYTNILEAYEMFFENLPFAVWIEDMELKILYLNNVYEKMYNVKYHEVFGKKNEDVFPKDLAEIYNSKIRECIEDNTIKVAQGSVEGTIIECWIVPLKDKNNKLKAVAGLITDISEKRSKEIEIESQKNILRTIIDALPESVFYKDRESRFIGYNKKFEEFYNERGITDIIGKTDLEIYEDKEVAAKFIELDKEIMSTQKAKYYEQVREDKKGRKVEEIVKIPIVDKNKNTWGVVGVARDITERKNMEDRLRYLSETDMLTKLYNRYSFEEKSKELNIEENLPLGIVMGDVNGLKIVNDTLGHLEGDKLLINISKILKEICESKGYAFRWGGDEFMLLLPNFNEEKCDKIIADINDRCSSAHHEFIQLSIALAGEVKNNLDEDVYDYIKKAEEKLYRKKLLEKKSVKSTVMESLKKSLEEKNLETQEHTERVTEYALNIGKIMKLRTSELDELILSAELHDIGKIAINEEILLKKGKLTDEEFEIIKTHTEKGYRIISASSELGNVAKCVLAHHEKYDGTGYPIGLKKEEIPIIARIISVADSYDVMTHDRTYKKAMKKDEAIEELKRCSGSQFDPAVVKCFIEYIKNTY